MSAPFYFSIFDDADNGTVENLTPIYRFLEEIGLRTTRSVWPLRGPGNSGIEIGGDCLEDVGYRKFVLDLQQRGFELALHGVQNGSAPRARISEGFEKYREVLGEYPRLHTNHSRNRDSIYWGPDRFVNPLIRFVIDYGPDRQLRFEGQRAQSQYFWGDLCREHITYARNLVFDEINLDRVNPSMPYHDPSKPCVPYWFSSTEGSDVVRFCRALTEKNQDRLEAEEGVCIMYTHFASGFVEHGRLQPRFAALMRRLAGKPGVFLPVGAILDRLRAQRGGQTIPARELARMEWRWLREKLIKGRT